MNRAFRALAVIIGLLAALLTAPTVLAAKPIVDIIHFAPFVDSGLCGFPIEISFDGDIRVTLFVNADGSPVREIDTFANFLVTFTHDGNVLTTKGPAHGIITFAADGSVESIEFDGMSANVTLPGQGQVLLDVGRIVWDGDGNLVAEDGIHEVFGTGSAPEFCAYMA